jgi:periplasmic protein TonB
MKHNPMKSRFGVPVAIALGLHAVLLFGFRRSPNHDPVEPIPRVIVWKVPDPLPVEEVLEKISDPEAAKTMRSRGAAVPRGPELPPISDPGPLIRMEPQRTFPSNVVPGLTTIPALIGDAGPSTGSPPDIRAIDLDNAPRVKFQAKPEYPRVLRSQGVTGEAVVEFVVDEAGRVQDARILRSSHREFEDAALRAVSKWVFESGKRHGRTVRFRMAVPIIFSLTAD